MSYIKITKTRTLCRDCGQLLKTRVEPSRSSSFYLTFTWRCPLPGSTPSSLVPFLWTPSLPALSSHTCASFFLCSSKLHTRTHTHTQVLCHPPAGLLRGAGCSFHRERQLCRHLHHSAPLASPRRCSSHSATLVHLFSPFILPISLSLSLPPSTVSNTLQRHFSPGFWRHSMHDPHITGDTALYANSTSHCQRATCTTWIVAHT